VRQDYLVVVVVVHQVDLLLQLYLEDQGVVETVVVEHLLVYQQVLEQLTLEVVAVL